MATEQAELRAERLRVTLFMFGVLHHTFDDMYADAAVRMNPADIALFQSTDRDDLVLANACLEVEYAMRRREWAALQRLLAAIPPGGALHEVQHLPLERTRSALRDMYECGWLAEAPES